MRVRSMLLSTVLCGGVLAIAAPAHAAPTLKPQGTWAVTKVEGKQPGATPYCALARRFGNGSIVTFARNSFNETSVAVDFPPGSFKTSQEYTVVLDPGAGETRSYKTKPVSERGIVIRMGRDDKFYTALEQNGKLGISVDDKGFDFAMADVKSGTQDLAACLGTSVEPASGSTPVKEAAAAPAPSPAPAPAPVVSASASELEAVKEENTRLRNALERERRVYEDKMQQSGDTSATAELSEKLQLLQRENAELKGQIVGSGNKVEPVSVAPVAACAPVKANDETVNLLRAENTQLKSDLEAQKQRIALAPDNAQLGTLKAENEKLKSELEADKQKMAAMTPSVTPTDSAEIGTLRAENTQLKFDLNAQKQKIASLEQNSKLADLAPVNSDASKAQIAGLQTQVAKLQDENQSLKSIVETRQASAADASASVATIARLKGMEAEMAQLKAERNRLSDQISSLSKVEGDGRIKISSDNWNLEQATQRYNQAELEIRRLGSVVEQERAKCSVDKQNIEYKLFDPKIAEKEQIAKLISLENQLAEAKQTRQDDGSKEKLAAADKSVQDLKSQLSTANDQLAQLKKSLDDTKQEKVAEVEQLKKTLDTTKQEKVAANEQSPVVETLRQEIASLNNQISNLQSEKAAAEKLERLAPASGGDTVAARDGLRLTPRPDTVVPRPAVEVDHDALPPAAAPLPLASSEPVSIMPPSSAAKPLPATVAETPVQAIASTANNVKLMGKGDLDTLLSQAGIKLDKPAQEVAGSTGPGRVTYRWETEGLFGTAEQKPMDSAAQYDRFVQSYLDKTKSRCKGQFAAVPGLVNMAGGGHISSYEIACVDEQSGDGASASLVFYSQNGTFTTIAHESSSESMDLAMDARDKIVAVIDGSQTASR